MNSNPLVSILVPVYNQIKVVEQTLNSIATQSYQNVEIIVSDDSSTDGTQELLKLISSKNNKIQLYLQKVNLGITKNYNFIASKASGKYLALFAGDDVMFPEKITEQVKLLEDNPDASFCHHAVEILDNATNKSRGIVSHRYVNGVTTIHDVLRNMGIPGAMAIMCRRDAVKVPLLNPEIPTASDWLQMIHLTMSGRGLYIDKPLCFYRKDTEYNGKDPSRYEDDFLKTIKATRVAYANPGDAIDKSCDYALARYSLGAGFRRMVRGDQEVARAHFKIAKAESKLMFAAFALDLISRLPISKNILLFIKRTYKIMAP